MQVHTSRVRKVERPQPYQSHEVVDDHPLAISHHQERVYLFLYGVDVEKQPLLWPPVGLDVQLSHIVLVGFDNLHLPVAPVDFVIFHVLGYLERSTLKLEHDSQDEKLGTNRLGT